MATTITRTFDGTPTDKTYFSLTDNMSSSNLGNIQVPDGSSRISRIDCAFDTPDTKGVIGVCRLSGSNMSDKTLQFTEHVVTQPTLAVSHRSKA